MGKQALARYLLQALLKTIFSPLYFSWLKTKPVLLDPFMNAAVWFLPKLEYIHAYSQAMWELQMLMDLEEANGSFSRHLPDSIHPSKKKKSLIPFNYHSLPVHLLFHHCWLQIYPCLNNIFPLYNQTTTTYSDNLRHSNHDFACRILSLHLVSLRGWGCRQITIYSEMKSWLKQHTKKIWLAFSLYPTPLPHHHPKRDLQESSKY